MSRLCTRQEALKSTIEQKKYDRVAAAKKRQALVTASAGEQAARNLLSALKPEASLIFSLYWSVGTELTTMPLLNAFTKRGQICALPVVEQAASPLIFRRFEGADLLVPGQYNIPTPPKSAEILVPDILIVPLLAFDKAGYRLGYGGGYYDRTLETLRKSRKGCLAVGYAYAGQETEHVTVDKYDQPLDWIITEKEARKIQ